MHMKNSRMDVVLVVAGLLLLADKAMAFPIMLGTAVPDGGSTALFLVAGLAGVGLFRRFTGRR
jgi:hypothetical protein